MGSRRLTAASLAITLAAGLLAFAAPARAEGTDWHVCYLENPSKVKVDLYNPLMGGEGVIALPFSGDLFTGDCPSAQERELNPQGNNTFYTSGGVDHFRSGIVDALWSATPNNLGIFSNTLVSGPSMRGGDWELLPPETILGQDIDGNAIRKPYLTFALPTSYIDTFGKSFAPSTVRMAGLWTGNLATEECDFDAELCPGGFTYADYEFRVRNAMTFKYATSIKVLKIKGGKRLAITVRIDRKLVDNGTSNFAGSEIRALPGDRVSVKVRGKKYYSRIVNSSTGKVTIIVPNPKGKQKFTVGIRSTKLNWGATKTFRR